MPTPTDWRPALALSQTMRAAAQRGEWETLAALELERRTLLANAGAKVLGVTPHSRSIAEEILQIDQEILELVGPYLDQLRPWMGRPTT